MGTKVRNKARLISLLNLCASTSVTQVSYTDLVKALGVPLAKLETWVTRGLTLGLLEGILDQAMETFITYDCLILKYTLANWKGVQTKVLHIGKVIEDKT